MELSNFANQITKVLSTNNVNYQYKLVGHVRPIENNLGVLYFTKDILIFLNDYKCIVDISFNFINNVPYLREMTIQVEGEKYGYKHCKIFDKKTNKKHELKLNTELNKEVLDYIKDYVLTLIKCNNDENLLHQIWKKSLTRTTYKKRYQMFYMDNMTIINKEQYQNIKNQYEIFPAFGEMIFFAEDNLN